MLLIIVPGLIVLQALLVMVHLALYQVLASAFGIGASRVADVGAPLERALRQALSSGEPRMVVCDASLFPPKTTSPRWRE